MSPPDWLASNEQHLLGISGGRDSVFLACWLHHFNFRKITLCHLNHQLRGKAADEDEEFCKELAAQLGYSFLSETVSVFTLAKKEQLSLETAARKARHEFFARCALETNCPRLLLAHHAEDQAETILFRLIRGSAGLVGMEPRKHIKINQVTLEILRPLLGVRRSQIDDFLAGHQIPFREDQSNSEDFAVRNRIRHEVIPLLSEIFSRDPTPPILRAEEHHRELRNLVKDQVAQLSVLDPEGRVHLPSLRKLPRALQRQVIHDYLRDNKIRDLSGDLVERALHLLETDSPPALALPGGLRLRRRQARLFISP